VVESPDGVRLIVGDARGKGLDAVQMAATVLATFRRAAALELPLTEIATDLDNVVSAVAGMEDFVTALLADLHDDHTVTLVNCGHHPPLLLTDGDTGALVDTGEPQPPLGLHPTPHPVTTHLPEGARMLFYTDGMIETRDRQGDFFPLTERADTLRSGTLDDALDGLLGQVADHAAEEIDDDMALVLAERHTRRDAA
jgi:serine phosphatase RsbU (regulator of sigma subunit)